MHAVPGRHGKGDQADGSEGLEQGVAVRAFGCDARRLNLRTWPGSAQSVAERHQIFSGRGRSGHWSEHIIGGARRGNCDMSESITFTIDGKTVQAAADE